MNPADDYNIAILKISKVGKYIAVKFRILQSTTKCSDIFNCFSYIIQSN